MQAFGKTMVAMRGDDKIPFGAYQICRHNFLPRGKKTLMDCIRIPINPIHLNRLAVIDDEDFSNVIGKAIDDAIERGNPMSDAQVDSRIYGLKQYYAAVLLDPYNSHAVSVEVDRFWHNHILHTHQYADFCNRMMGAYIHHIPLNRLDRRQMANIADVYGHTIRTLTEIFGELDPTVWTDNGLDNQYICWGGSRAAPQIVLDSALFQRSENGQSYMLEDLNRKHPV